MDGEGFMVQSDVALLCTRGLRVAEAREFDRARALLQRAMENAGEDKRLQGRVRISLCRLDTLRGDFDEARRHGVRALDLLQAHGHPDGIAEAAIYLGSVEGNQSRFPAAEAMYSKALRMLANSDDQRLLALAHWGMASAANDQQRFQEAYDHARIAAECGKELLTLGERGRLQHLIGVICRDRDMFEDALACELTALRMLEIAGELEVVADTHNTVGSIHARRGDRCAARASYQQALAALSGEVTPQTADAYHEMARIDLEEGQASAALDHARMALEAAVKVRSDLDEGRAALALGQALVSLGRREDALPHVRRALEIFTACRMSQSQLVARDILRYAEGGT